jgi:hypothetical protein
MKKLAFPIALVAALCLSAASLADDGHGKNHVGAKDAKITSSMTALDNGSCQNKWATDTVRRTMKVHQTAPGTYRVTLEDKGTATRHGQTVLAGITGRYHGRYEAVVTGGTFNANGSCASPCQFGPWFAAYFGPSAQVTCRLGQNPCRYDFVYEAKPDTGLLFHRWQDLGTGTTETLKGDIANA